MFMASLGRLRRLMDGAGDKADFAFIYISEAHPAETEDFVGENIHKINTHSSLDERINAAEILHEEIGEDCVMLIDDLDDAANIAYCAYPDRIYVLRNEAIEFEGKPGPYSFDPAALKTKLHELHVL